MRLLRLTSLASILVTICVAHATAQEALLPTAPVDENSKREAALPEYVLEVTRADGCVASPISPKSKRGSVLYALPRPAKVQPDSSGQPITSKVFVWAIQENEQWRVRVSIGTGEFFDAGDHQVGDFKLNVNQRTTVPEVRKFGLNPLRVGVMKIVRQPVGKPRFVNLTQSVALESLETRNLPDPFKLTLKNNSVQDLIAIQYNTFTSRGFLELKWFSPGLLRPLVKTSESYKLEVKSEDNSCGNEEGYSPNQLNRIELVTAVFADGSYEGQPALAALIKGAALGNRKNLERVVATIGHITDAAELAQQLEYLQQGMNEETDPYLVQTLLGMFPTLPPNAPDVLNNYIRSGMHEVKANLIADAKHLQMLSKRATPEASKRWVDKTKAKYERWWIAAQNMTSH